MNKFVWKKNSAKKNVTFYPLFDSINIDCVVVVAFAMYTNFSPFSFYSGKPIEGFCNYCRYFFFDLTKWNWHFSKKKDEAWKAIRIKTNRKQFNAAQRINRNKKKNKQRTSLMYKTKLSKQIQSWNDDLIRFFVDVVVAGCCWLLLAMIINFLTMFIERGILWCYRTMKTWAKNFILRTMDEAKNTLTKSNWAMNLILHTLR